ncbi:coiled-coil domain-containing protein 60 [Phaenicophaeus curvirostris]|uniref:coiled-coil domain-containing protein 60 n=1 Tax=Phaenicophaeus curvirostris TaxID=33595 RepID=UPI0037F0CF1A
MMPVPDAPENCRVKAPVGANTGKSSRPKAPGVPDPPRNKRAQALAVTEVLNPRDFVCIQALPDSAQKAGEVLARARTIYRSSEPTREQVFWENYRRRKKQLTEGYFTPIGKPYLELGEILSLEPKNLTLYSSGQLTQELVEDKVQEKPPKEVAEVTANEYSSSRESDPPEPSKKLFQVRETGKELRTLSKALTRSRQHLNSVKKGGQHFHILHQESLQKKNTLKAAKQAQGTMWRIDLQPGECSSDAKDSDEEIDTCSLTEGSHLRDSGKKKKKMTLRSFAPLCVSVLIPNPPGAKSEHLFRQLCAIHWLLEALTLESNNPMRSILTCWNPTDPGGRKKTIREIEEETLATLMEELLIANIKKSIWKTLYSPFRRKMIKTSTLSIPQLSRRSSLRGQTPRDSITSTVLGSEDNIKISVASSDVMSESAQAKEQQPLFPSLQKVIQKIREEASKDVHKQEVIDKKTGLKHLLPESQKNHRVNMPFIKDQESTIARNQRPRRQGCHISSFIKSKSNLCDNMRQKFTAVHDAAACRLHDTLESLEWSQEERCYKKYQALKHLKYFRRDIERIRQLDRETRTKYDENGLNWFPVLLARLPESVKSDHYVQKILKKLEKFGKNPDLKIPPDTFVKVLADLQVWELCSPEIAAAVEFVRESIVQMPEKDFSEWLQTRVAPLCAQSSTF